MEPESSKKTIKTS